MRTYLEALPAGSYVVLSHFYAPEGEDGAMVHRIRQTMLERQLDADFFRTYREIEALFPAGLEFVEPGLAVCRLGGRTAPDSRSRSRCNAAFSARSRAIRRPRPRSMGQRGGCSEAATSLSRSTMPWSTAASEVAHWCSEPARGGRQFWLIRC